MIAPWAFSVAAGVSAVVSITGKYRRSNRLVYASKPLTTILILALAVSLDGVQTRYGQLVVFALALSVLGDIFLMLPRDRFMQGLLSFLVAHLVLIGAFTLQWPDLSWWLFLIFALFASGMYLLLSPHLGPMRLPVAFYIVVIGTMAWFGWERWFEFGSISALLAATGGSLFLISDSTLALNRFKAPFWSADAISLGTYWTSLLLIALSVLPGWG